MTRPTFVGTFFALAAGRMWGLVFIALLMLPDYPAALLSLACYLAFGLIAVALARFDRRRLGQFTRGDWVEALKLSMVDNLLYYLFLAAAIQRAGGPWPTMIIGTLPVVIAISSNLRDAKRDGRLPWLKLAPSLALIGLGIGFVNHVEIEQLRSDPNADMTRYAWGALMLAIGLLACWGGTLCWNEASQRLPTTLAGQLIIFETLAALAYAFTWRGHPPAGMTVMGIALLVAGVIWALHTKLVPLAADAHPA